MSYNYFEECNATVNDILNKKEELIVNGHNPEIIRGNKTHLQHIFDQFMLGQLSENWFMKPDRWELVVDSTLFGLKVKLDNRLKR